MKAVIQRVSSASVKVENQIIAQIKQGLVVLLGITNTDTEKDIDIMVDKIKNLRIFEDKDGKMNVSINDINGQILIVPQFTLLADLEKGRRPSFANAAKPELAENIYNQVINKFKEIGIKIESAKFREYMQVQLINEGPATFIFATKKNFNQPFDVAQG